MRSQAFWLGHARTLHRRLMWPAGIALVCFVVSAITHPIMVWTGPQAEHHRPPAMHASVAAWQENSGLMNQLPEVKQALLTPTETEPALRVTTADAVHYLRDAQPLADNFDQEQAVWLARYYLGEQVSQAEINSVQFIDAFSEAYPSVNRLLPVWRVEFDTEDQLHVYVDTQTRSLALVANNYKVILQRVFQWLHTHSWLDAVPPLQFLVTFLLALSLLVFSLAGTALIFAYPRARRVKQPARRWHRGLALVLYVPLIALAGSGLYHTLYKQLQNPHEGPQLLSEASTGQLSMVKLPSHMDEVQQLSQVVFADGSPGVRLQLSADNYATSRSERYAGRPSHNEAIYLNETGITDYSDSDLVNELLDAHGFAAPKALTLVTRFGGLYDFRNKRLPVWKAVYEHEVIFVDPSAQVLVERVATSSQWERWSFSQLHKWSFVTPWLTRQGRDVLVVFVLMGFMVLLCAGIRLAVKKR